MLNGIIYYKKNSDNVFMLSRSASTIQSLFSFEKGTLEKIYSRWPSSKDNLYILFEGKEFKLES